MQLLNVLALSFCGVVLLLFIIAVCYYYYVSMRRSAAKPDSRDEKVDGLSESTKLSNFTWEYERTAYDPKPDKTVGQITSTDKGPSAWSYVGSLAWDGNKRIIDNDKPLGWGLLAATALAAGGGPKKKRRDERYSQRRRGTGWSSYDGGEFHLGGDDGGGGDGGCGGGDGGGGE